mmetsp:Transcript_4809/g.14492  ORF Transcript_4809/g.14492 Transcript_4809/m.14492 type:complete len:133 (-) Transcript_4809:1137-1535(-)
MVMDRNIPSMPELTRETQLADLRTLEDNLRCTVQSLQKSRRRYLALLSALLTLSFCSTWRLRLKLMSTESASLWIFTWFCIGILPLLMFFVYGMQRYLSEPELYVERLNLSLRPLNIEYSIEVPSTVIVTSR